MIFTFFMFARVRILTIGTHRFRSLGGRRGLRSRQRREGEGLRPTASPIVWEKMVPWSLWNNSYCSFSTYKKYYFIFISPHQSLSDRSPFYYGDAISRPRHHLPSALRSFRYYSRGFPLHFGLLSFILQIEVWGTLSCLNTSHGLSSIKKATSYLMETDLGHFRRFFL